MIQILIAVLLVFLGFTNVLADTHTAASCNVADIQHEHDNHASRGDTIAVPAGSCTWNTTLNITKAITLQGAGAGSTTITTGFSASGGAAWGQATGETLIFIQPSSIADDTNELMRITGFTFVLTSGSYTNGAILVNNFSNTPLAKFRVDNNVFSNCYWDGNNNSYSVVGIGYSTVYGVIDSNTFSGQCHIYFKGRGKTGWDTFNWMYGTGNSMFVEDNTFSASDFPNNNGNGISNVWRYNTITMTADQYALDLGNSHGNDTNTGTYSSFGSEVYGNKVILAAGSSFIRFGANRGGKNVMFYNRVDKGSNIAVMEYEGTGGAYGYDYGSPTNTVCPSGTLYANGSRTGCSTLGYPQHVNQTYIWNNREGSGDGTIMDISNYNPTSPTLRARQNVDFFSDYYGSTYMGCGTSLPSTCSTGAGYWYTTQSCSTVPAAGLGANPTTPISGTLYRCSPANTWNVWYTPYTYPHPLRGTADTTAPTVSNINPTAEQACTDASEPYTQDVAISLSTNENATCKWDTSVDGSPTYTELSNTFTGGGTQSHTATVTGIACGTGQTVYYACKDTSDNESTVASWTFTVASKAGATPTITSATLTNQSCSLTNKLVVSTSVASTCRYCVHGVSGCASDTAWASRTNFTVTGSDTVHHEVGITQACSSSAVYNVICQDAQANESSNSAITITTDAAKSVTLGTGSLTIGIGTGSNTISIK